MHLHGRVPCPCPFPRCGLSPRHCQVLGFILWYVRTWSAPPDPVMIDGQFSKFSIVVMSYDARLLTLQVRVFPAGVRGEGGSGAGGGQFSIIAM